MTIKIKRGIQPKDSEFSIRIKDPDDNKFWYYGEQKESLLWDIYIINPKNELREIIKENVTTKTFLSVTTIGLLQKFDLSKTREAQLNK